MRRLTLAFPSLFTVLALTACGVRGDVERPPPIWGADERTAEERAHEAEDEAETDAQDGAR